MDTEVRSVQDVQKMVIANHGAIHQIRKIFGSREIGMFYSRIKPRGALPLEVHKFVEIIYRIKGRTNMKIGDREFLVSPGDYVVVPEGVWHQTTSIEDAEEVEQVVLCAYDVLEGSFFNSFR